MRAESSKSIQYFESESTSQSHPQERVEKGTLPYGGTFQAATSQVLCRSTMSQCEAILSSIKMRGLKTM